MNATLLFAGVAAAMWPASGLVAAEAGSRPWSHGHFSGRIAYSCDGNHNDPDDWIASPLSLAILAEAGLRDRLVHFDYNSILPLTNSDWEKTHARSVLGAADRFGFHRSTFFDCRKDLDGAISSITKAINQSSAEDPLYFLIAGPMEVPCRGILASEPAKRPFVCCISHSRWNDGFSPQYQFNMTKRSVIELGVRWVQIADQNRLLSFGRYGQPAPIHTFEPYFWMRDSKNPNLQFLWERMKVSTRPDPSDAGMTYFLATGDETCDPGKLRRLLAEGHSVEPRAARERVRLEAENFRHLEGFALEDRNDRDASHRLNVLCRGGGSPGQIRTRFDEPFTAPAARYDVEVRYQAGGGGKGRLTLKRNGTPSGPAWQASAEEPGWRSHVVPDVPIEIGDELAVETQSEEMRLDYVQLVRRPPGPAASTAGNARSDYFPPPEAQGGWRSLVRPNQPASDAEKTEVRGKAGMDWDQLEAAQSYCASFGTPNHLLIIRHGWITGEWMNFTNARGIASCTKSLTALAMAKLFDLSDADTLPVKVTIEDEAWRYLPAAWSNAEEARKQIRLRHLLTMTSGLTPYDGPYGEDYGKRVFEQTVEAQPGAVWAYASVPVDMLSLVIEEVTGLTEEQFFNEKINAVIGAAPVKWGKFGVHAGGSGGPQGGARFPARELARVGYLVLHDGGWAQGQVLSAARVREITRWAPWLAEARWRQPNFAWEPNANQYYGHLWWNNRTGEALGDAVPHDAVYMSGWGKQACFVVPSLDLVVVRLGSHRKLNDHPEFYTELWKRILAAVL